MGEESATAQQDEQTTTAGRFELGLVHPLEVSLNLLDGFGAKTAQRLRDRGIMDQLDLLLFTPRKYRKIYHFMPGAFMLQRQVAHVEFYGCIEEVRMPQGNPRAPVQVIVRADGEGDVQFKLLWFNAQRSGFLRALRTGRWLHINGKVDYERHPPSMLHPDIEQLDAPPSRGGAFISIDPVYPSMEGIPDSKVRKGIREALYRLGPFLQDVVPRALRQERALPSVKEALETIHVTSPVRDVKTFAEDVARARQRLVYEEFYTLQRKLAEDVAHQRERGAALVCADREPARAFIRDLPFAMTGDQKRAVATVARDMERPVPMRRLVQGDVGAGKTVVGLAAAALAIGNGGQVAMMAPTDILARQHLRRAEEFFEGKGIRKAFLGGSCTTTEKRETLRLLAAGEIDLLVGTHALFQKDVIFENLRLAMIDEQHKFGVEQRDLLLGKGVDTHLLSMTATPIPRSLAHAVFGDLDLTIIREKPPGRQPIRTVLRDSSRAQKIYAYVRERIEETGEQAYFVYPMIEESAAAPGRRNVLESHQKLSEGPFAGLNVGLLHGRLSSDEKDEVMRQFSEGALHVLCSTTVIEVGVDVANATVMVIESPEVFGLSQLHQLRGRVGRGEVASMCILVAAQNLSGVAVERLVSFKDTDDGFDLAEADLRLRGPGLFLGKRQAGTAEFRFGDLFRDGELLEQARRDARAQVLGEEDEGEAEEL